MPKVEDILGQLNKDGVPDVLVNRFLDDIKPHAAKYSSAVAAAQTELANSTLLEICRYTQRLFVDRGHLSMLDEVSKRHFVSTVRGIVSCFDRHRIDADTESGKHLIKAMSNIRARLNDALGIA